MGSFDFAYYMFEMVDRVEVVDEYTFRFYLQETFAPFLSHVAMNAFSMVSPTAVEEYGADFHKHPVGTGPFRFVSWNPGIEIVLEKNPDYFKGPPKLDRLIFRPIRDDNLRLNEFEAGRTDMICDILPDRLSGLKVNNNFTVLEQPGLHTWYLIMNCSKAPFDKREVRQAMYYAIDRQAIVEDILQGTGILANNFLPPLTFAYTDDVPKYEYNPDKARELLKEAGYPDGFSIDFYIPESGSGMQQPTAMGIAIQSYLTKVGIIVNIIQLEWGAYLDRAFLPAEEQDILLMEISWLSDDGDPDNFLYGLCSSLQMPYQGYNFAYYQDEDLDQLLLLARATTDQSQRERLYKQAQQIIMTEVPYLAMDHEIQIVATKKKVTGFKLQPRGLFRFHDVDIIE
jgi:peptide/nickel transport system substrate-binding protein